MQLCRSLLYTKAAVTSNNTSRPRCCSCKPAARLLWSLLQIAPLQAVKQDFNFDAQKGCATGQHNCKKASASCSKRDKHT